MGADNGGIGISKQKLDQHWYVENDRTLYEWQFHAGHIVERTIDQHLAAIRFFEDVVDGKPFEKLTIRDVDLARSALKDAISAQGEARKSRTTVSHQASQIMAFLEWLIKQDGFKRLP